MRLSINVQVNEIKKLTKGVPALVDTVQSKLSEGSDRIKNIGCRVDQNRKGIDELEISIKKMQNGGDGSPTSNAVLRFQSGGDGMSLANVMANQARFSTELQLGNSSTMLFSGELHKYVQFVTMFRNTFDKTINDSVALYDILMRHVKGPA